MSDSSDEDKPIGLRNKKQQDGEIDKDNLSDYQSDNSIDSETKRAQEEEEIRLHRIQMAKRAAK